MNLTIFSILGSVFGSNETNNKPVGAEAVRTAITEIRGLGDKKYEAVLGEPDVIEEEGQFYSHTQVVVPIRDSPYSGSNRLVFDVPVGIGNPQDTGEVFDDFLDAFGLGFEDMEELEGQRVPVYYVAGNEVVAWEEMVEDDEDVEEVAEE